MTRSEALKFLESKTLHERLRAARYLSLHALPEDEFRIRQQLAREEVSWIRGALQRALDRLAGSIDTLRPLAADSADQDARQIDDTYAQAVEDTTKALVHELEPILGLLRLFAEKEIDGYASSRTKEQLDRLESCLTAFGTLSRAAGIPTISEFDVPDLVRRIVAGVKGDSADIQLAGPDPMPIRGDTSLVELALDNGLRNAVEASNAAAGRGQLAMIVVNWGETDRDYWIVVLDRGVGLPTSAARMFEIGETTKEGHLGMGLTLARRAALSLGGSLIVESREGGGVRFEVRWPKIPT